MSLQAGTEWIRGRVVHPADNTIGKSTSLGLSDNHLSSGRVVTDSPCGAFCAVSTDAQLPWHLVTVLVSTHDLCWLHDTGRQHPERPERLTAVKQGIDTSEVRDAISWIEAPDAPRQALLAVHPASILDRLADLSAAGGGSIDPDTVVSSDSSAAAIRAAGAGLDLIRRLDAGEADAGWSIVRPPGHHALASVQMGFCLINNIAVAARFLADRGERVAIVDIDAHHGNGTQDIFYTDPDVLFVSLHQYPWYPYTGRPDEVGEGDGVGTTVNIAMPAGATGDVYRSAIEAVVAPVVMRHQPTWLLVSAGFDGHRADPITDLGLTSTDYAEMAGDLLQLVPAGRRLLFLEGGYELEALSNCAAGVVAATAGVSVRPEDASTGGPGADMVELSRAIHLS